MANEFSISINKDSQGNDVSLSSMPIEAAEALNVFMSSLTEFAKLVGSGADVNLSLRSGSIQSVLSYPEDQEQIGEDIQAVLDNTSRNKDYIKLFKHVQQHIQTNGLEYRVQHKKADDIVDLTNVFRERRFIYRRGPRVEWMEEVQFLTGKLFESGGRTKTNVHIECGEDTFKVECTKDQAKRLNRLLYDTVFISAKRRSKEGKKDVFYFIDQYLSEAKFCEYRDLYHNLDESDDLERFDQIHERIIEIVNNENESNGEILKIMRLYNNLFSDRGILRTILMTTKPLRNSVDGLDELYSELSETLRKGNTNDF
ncbi:MAG: hypothetical protein ACON34_03660 [Flavobacteriales bacterium]